MSPTPDPIAQLLSDVEREARRRGLPHGLREVLFCLRDIPYGRPASPRDTLAVLHEWKGTCSGKHLLAQRVLERLEVASTLYCQPYRLDDALAALPPAVVGRYAGQGLWDVHNYLVAHLSSGPARIDLTWSRDMADRGFTTTLDWDGRSDFRIAAGPGEAIAVESGADLGKLKDGLLDRLNPPAARALREDFIEALTRHASAAAAPRGRVEGIAATLDSLR